MKENKKEKGEEKDDERELRRRKQEEERRWKNRVMSYINEREEEGKGQEGAIGGGGRKGTSLVEAVWELMHCRFYHSIQ